MPGIEAMQKMPPRAVIWRVLRRTAEGEWSGLGEVEYPAKVPKYQTKEIWVHALFCRPAGHRLPIADEETQTTCECPKPNFETSNKTKVTPQNLTLLSHVGSLYRSPTHLIWGFGNNTRRCGLRPTFQNFCQIVWQGLLSFMTSYSDQCIAHKCLKFF